MYPKGRKETMRYIVEFFFDGLSFAAVENSYAKALIRAEACYSEFGSPVRIREMLGNKAGETIWM